MTPLYPVLYWSHDTQSVGSAVVRNTGRKAVETISLSLYVDRYMDEPTTVGVPFTLAPGEERTVDVFGLFREDLLEITEGTKASARVTVTHAAGRGEYERNQTAGLEFHNRNALSWDDDQRIASFVTAKDPEVLTFSRNVVSWTVAVANQALDRNFQKGAALFEAVRAHGVRYAIDPVTPFDELSDQADAIDFRQFPRQTLQWRNHHAAGQAAVCPTRDGWSVYPAVGFREDAGGFGLPDCDRVTGAFSAFIATDVRQQLDPQIATLRERVWTSRHPVPHLNRIGRALRRGDRGQRIRPFADQHEQHPSHP